MFVQCIEVLYTVYSVSDFCDVDRFLYCLYVQINNIQIYVYIFVCLYMSVYFYVFYFLTTTAVEANGDLNKE